MFGSIGGPELILILVVAFLLFGPRKLPEIGRSLGRAVAEFRRATVEFRTGLEREIEYEKFQDAGAEIRGLRRDVTGMLQEAAGLGEIPAIPAAAAGAAARVPASPPSDTVPSSPAEPAARDGSEAHKP